jgi:phosphoglycerate dehydrogenase-like enzyme
MSSPRRIKVLVTAAVPKAAIDAIAATSDRVEVLTISEEQRSLMLAGGQDDQSPAGAALRELLNEAEVIFCGYEARKSGDLLARAPNLKWLHTVAAGIEDFLERGFGRGNYQFTNGSGPHAIPMGEFVTLLVLMFAKEARQFLKNQERSRWERVGGREVYGSTAGIVGLGDVGMGAAERLKALGCRVLATRRSVAAVQRNVGPVDELLPASELPYLLRESDYVILAVPLTPETRHLINAEALRMMKPSTYLINVARGGVVDEAALIEALRTGVIAGAALDVFDTEPLPPDSPFWQMENVIVTPHISPTSGSAIFMQRHVDLFRENLRRYLAGEPLLNVVNVEKGY